MFQVNIPLAGRSAEELLNLARNKAKERKDCLIMGTTEAGQVYDDGVHMADYNVETDQLVITVLHKPSLVPRGLVERELKQLFS